MRKKYPEYYTHLRELVGRVCAELPGPMAGFAALHTTAVADGALNTKTKELIALGIAIVVRCDGCISYNVHDAIAAGAAKEEIIETIGISVLGGGPAMVYEAEALDALDQFESEAKPKQRTQQICRRGEEERLWPICLPSRHLRRRRARLSVPLPIIRAPSC
jgi:AhpD family alkylhydroperoxidase